MVRKVWVPMAEAKVISCRTAFLIACFFWTALSGQAQEGVPDAVRYVGSSVCKDCHLDETQAWKGSHHALAWTTPTEDNVLADFDGTKFSQGGMHVEFRTENGDYFADVTENDGETTDYRIQSVAGIAPLQQYLIETEPGRLQSFDVAWDVENARWYHLYPDQDLPPDDGLHWTGPYKTWNARCAECHATGFIKNYDHDTETYASTQAEIGVGCEACHGPASAHLAWANEEEVAGEGAGLNSYGFAFAFGQSVESDIQQCAGCHARREPFGQGNPVPGTAVHDAYNISVLRPGLYHADGQILDEVYVYGSFLQSKMYANGVGCGNCHDAHSAALVADGNAICTQCHSASGNSDFPSLRLAEYDAKTHHFHEPQTEGAQCKNCHMTERNYMGIDGRRDHSFRVPRPDLNSVTGAPDACTDCHEDRDPEWAANVLSTRYPDSAHRGQNFGEVLALGRRAPDLATADLLALAEDSSQPDIVRATALYLLQSASNEAIAARAAKFLADESALVRTNAIPVQRGANLQDRVIRIAALLSDVAGSVRIAAARELVGITEIALPADVEIAKRKATSEWQASISAKLDFPETQLVLGGLALTLRNTPAATRAFREVVRLDPQRSEAWIMLVRITAATEGSSAASRVLDEALNVLPDDPNLLDLKSQL